MANIGIVANTSFANVVTPLNPVVRQPVGLESADSKGDIMPALLEAEQSAKAENRDAQKDPFAKVQDKGEQQKEHKEQAQQDEKEQKAQEEQEVIRQLAARDREVRAHEQAHASVGGQYAGTPSYTFERGPDGVRYAIGGEVPISLPSQGGDPEATIQIAEQVQRAALAPAEPSPDENRSPVPAGAGACRVGCPEYRTASSGAGTCGNRPR